MEKDPLFAAAHRRIIAWLDQPSHPHPTAVQSGSDEAGRINQRQFATASTPVLRSIVFVAGFIGLLAAGSDRLQNTGEAAPGDFNIPASAASQELVAAAQLVALHLPEPIVETGLTRAPDTPSSELTPAQYTSVNPSDIEPVRTDKATKSFEIVDQCLVVDICVDRYVWALYQRAPKEGAITMREWRKSRR